VVLVSVRLTLSIQLFTLNSTLCFYIFLKVKGFTGIILGEEGSHTVNDVEINGESNLINQLHLTA